MGTDDCYDKVRFALSDKSGELRFVQFDIEQAPECASVVQQLRNILVNKRLADIDLAEIRRLSCPGSGQCIHTVVRIIDEHQERFLRNRSRHTRPDSEN